MPKLLIVTGEFAKSIAAQSAASAREQVDQRIKSYDAQAAHGRENGDERISRFRAQASHGFGTHNVDEGDTIHFKAGAFSGKGTVKSIGKDGAVVEDVEVRAHLIHWQEVTGFKAPRGKARTAETKTPAGAGVKGTTAGRRQRRQALA